VRNARAAHTRHRRWIILRQCMLALSFHCLLAFPSPLLSDMLQTAHDAAAKDLHRRCGLWCKACPCLLLLPQSDSATLHQSSQQAPSPRASRVRVPPYCMQKMACVRSSAQLHHSRACLCHHPFVTNGLMQNGFSCFTGEDVPMTAVMPEEQHSEPPAGINRDDAKTTKTENERDGGESGPKTYAEVGYGDIFKQFVLLGWTAFGGPAAHIALFQVSVAVLCIRRVRCLSGGGERADRLTPQKIFLEDNLNWMSSSLFMELFALGKSSASAMRRAARRPGCVEETRGSTLTSWARTRPVPAGAHLDAGVVRHRASEEGRGRGSAFGHAVPVPGAADDVLHWVGCRGGRLGEPLLQR